MNTAHFQNLPEHLCHYLSEAQNSICAAVCWFSHKDIFETLIERLRAGIPVALLIEYDSQNIKDGGLDFQRFICAGGQLWACRKAGLMHHKFALVDDRQLLTGSFNWTYNSNAENLLLTDDTVTLSAFREKFDRQKADAQRIFQVRCADAKVFAAFPLFENTLFSLTDLRKKVSCGTNTWLVRLDSLKIERSVVFLEHQIPFDAENLLAPFWIACRSWNETHYEEEMNLLKSDFTNRFFRDLRCWAQRMKIGDLVFAWRKNNRSKVLIAVGIIQSHPQPFTGEGFSSSRSVQWLKIIEETPYLLPEGGSGQRVAKFRGATLRVLQEVFGN